MVPHFWMLAPYHALDFETSLSLFSPLASLPPCQQSHGQRRCRGTNLPRAPHHRRGWHLASWQRHHLLKRISEDRKSHENHGLIRALLVCYLIKLIISSSGWWISKMCAVFFLHRSCRWICRLIVEAQGAWDHLEQATLDALRTPNGWKTILAFWVSVYFQGLYLSKEV